MKRSAGAERRGDARLPARIVGLGQPVAGDDGVGPAVIASLRARGGSADLELVVAAEASALVELVQFPGPVVIVDALLGGTPGEVRVIAEGDLSTTALSPLSSHGLSAGAALALARSIAAESVSPEISIVGVTITRPDRYGDELAPAVAAAVEQAADAVLRCARGGWAGGGGR